jgi:glycosyltransferase involved in cell wall biosynthesis
MSIDVSICLPTLNSRRFLTDRLESIRQQSFSRWEVVAVDSYSDDGTFGMLENFAAGDARVRVSQAPRDGIYPNFNRCIRQAKGRFVYIATSDDTMAPDCLEKLTGALVENPDCDLAHCPMRVIDEDGLPGRDWWSGNSMFARSSGDLLNYPHKRIAPLDGILCMLGDNIYSSVTQLLVKRSLFDKIGFYQSDWGSLGDFHWNLRAGLAASTVHVPDTWGGWRMHSSQATAGVLLGSADHQAMIDDMIHDVLANLDRCLGAKDWNDVFVNLVRRACALRSHLRQHARHTRRMERRLFLIREALLGKGLAWQHLASLSAGHNRWPGAAPQAVRGWLEGGGLARLSDWNGRY